MPRRFNDGNAPAIRALLTGLALLAVAPALRAQSAPTALAALRDCAGPLAKTAPACQGAAAKAEPNAAPSARRPAVNSAAPPLRSPANTAPVEPPAPRETPPEAPAVPEPPTEFQRFAASSAGEVLPIFGASLFDRAPSTFAPLDRAPVGADYVVGPGDELLVRAWGQLNFDLSLTVDRGGAVFIPQVGNIRVAGLEYGQAQDAIRAQVERVFRNFHLTVAMGQLRSVGIVVAGHVRRPGTYTVSSLSTLVNALFASGGPSAQGSMRRIQLKRRGKPAAELDLYDVLLKGDQTNDSRLEPGDLVYVPPAGPQVAVAGSVRSPGIYELKGETAAGALLDLAGGLTALADRRRAVLERVHDGALATMEFALDAAGFATPVRDGDVLRIASVPPRFENAITLRGNVANPGRFAWREGMRLRDIIPNKDSLITREYWSRRNALGFRPQEPAEANAEKPRSRIEIVVPDINWSYAVIERQNPRDLAAELIPFHPGRLVLEGDETQNLALRAGDVVTIFSQADVRVSTGQQTRFVRLEGEFEAAGVYAVRPGETLGQLIQRAGGFTSQAYLYGAELLRESTRVDQQRRLDQFARDLESEVEHTAALRIGAATSTEDAAALTARLETQRRFVEKLRHVEASGRVVLNFEPGDRSTEKLLDVGLEDGDRFVVPVRPATVNVLGAVYNQNAFLYDSGLRVEGYIRNAGGATRNADMGRAFIIRADGRVLPKRGAGKFDALALNPGDSVVVPEQMFKGSFLRGLRDWTQVFSQLALGAAAVNILR